MCPQLPPRGVRFNFYGGPHDGHVELASADEPTSWGALQWSASEGGRVGYRFAVVSELLAQTLASTLERFEESGELDLTPLDGASAHCFEIVSQEREDDDTLSAAARMWATCRWTQSSARLRRRGSRQYRRPRVSMTPREIT